ncbi:MAG: hypothetical protein EP335_14970 [Alphaproteobacteria bacterium]|nr:MAG: hypothetical protein EP335_14970 [Alphaproteobacteria bacterium]
MHAGTDQKIRVAVLAGRRPQGDPIADMFGVPYKAAARIGERAMLNRVLDAIDASGVAHDIYILLQSPEVLAGLEDFAPLRDRPDVHFIRSGGSICESLRDFAGTDEAAFPLLVTTSDHVLLQADDIRTFLARAPEEADLAVGLIEDSTVLAEHPSAQRTWLRFRDGAYTTCNLFLMQHATAGRVLDFWSVVEKDRKKPLRLAWRFGPITCLRFLLKRLGLQDAFGRGSKVIGADVRPVVLHRANLSIDVDKPADVVLVREILGY